MLQVISVYYIDKNNDRIYRYKDTVILQLKSYICYTSGNFEILEMFTKKRIMCNVYARITVLAD